MPRSAIDRSGPAVPAEPAGRARLSAPLVIGLATVGAPRVVAHDLGFGGPVVAAVLTLAVPAAWVLAVLALRVPRPFATLTATGLAYGALLAVAHQVLWDRAFAGAPPRLGERLAGLPDLAHEALTRAAAVLSSLGTGLALGALAGALALGVARLGSRRHRG